MRSELGEKKKEEGGEGSVRVARKAAIENLKTQLINKGFHKKPNFSYPIDKNQRYLSHQIDVIKQSKELNPAAPISNTHATK